MRKMEIVIENDKSALVEIKNSPNDFGVFSKSQTDFFIGFENEPLFEVSQSLVNERWFFDVPQNGRKIRQEDIIFRDLCINHSFYFLLFFMQILKFSDSITSLNWNLI